MTSTLAVPPALTLTPGVVDLWTLALDVSVEARALITASLDDTEREQWLRMRVGGERWAVARGARRHVLAAYLGTPPESLRFDHGEFGKPWLADHRAVRFSASARNGLALLAVSSEFELGVDLEQHDTANDPEQVAREFLSPLEQAAIAATSLAERRGAFAAAWTRHEARRKALGAPLEDPLPGLAPGSAVVVRAVAVPEGFAAAIAAEGGDWRVRVRDAGEVLPLI